MNILIIDDERTFSKLVRSRDIVFDNKITYARTFEEAWDALYNHDFIWDIVFLDHDLGEDEGDVRELTQQLEREAYMGTIFPIRKFVIHSMNPLGRKEMYEALHKFYNVEFARVEDLI